MGQVTYVIGLLRRRYPSILAFLFGSLAIGALYLLVAPPSFTASATMMIDARRSPALQSIYPDAPTDGAWIESQLGILKSENVALNVVKQLHLAEDAEFTRSDAGLLSQIRAFVSGNPFLGQIRTLVTGKPPRSSESRSEESTRQAAAVAAVIGGLDVRRVGPSYLVRIEFRSRNAALAAKIANAVVDAYASDQLIAKYEANQRSSEWLRERLDTLREQTAAAERAVVEFRAKNNIIATDGKLMSDQQLSDLNNQLTAIRAHAAEVQARLGRIESVLRSNEIDGAKGDETVTDTLNNAIITDLRKRYLDLLNREADWSVKFGKDHSAVTTLRKQMQDIRKSITDELRRIAETYKSEFAIAKVRQETLEKQLAAGVTKLQDTNQAEVTLHGLESAAQSYRKIYDDFLQRHTESVQTQSLPATEARLISPASVYQTQPQTSVVWMTSILAGMMFGLGFAALREFLDHVFRTSGQLQSVVHTECLAMVPALALNSPRALLPKRQQQRFDVGRGRPRSISPEAITFRTVIDAPFSPFADAIRSMKLTVDLNGGAKHCKVIGLTSCVPNEGKSTVSLGMAALIARSGKRVLLMDLDFRNPTQTRTLSPNATGGLLDLVAQPSSIESAIWTDPDTGMAFLPLVIHRDSPNSTDVLSSDAMEALLATLRETYDYVIVDLPPLAPMVDVRATSHLIDSYILVVEWGRTRIDTVQRILSRAHEVRENMVGAVLNKVELNTVGRYDPDIIKYYYGKYHKAG